MHRFHRAKARVDHARRYVLPIACAIVTLSAMVFPAAAQNPLPPVDTFSAGGAAISISPVQQMSVVIKTPAGIIYTDPTGGARRYAGYPKPDIILISHEHGEHYDAATLADLIMPSTRIVVPPYVMAQLPEPLRGHAIVLANGERTDLGAVEVEAIPSYGLGGAAEQWHPRGRGNGYIVTVNGQRLYIAGSSEAIPEMLALRDIYLAVLPLYPPYALGPEDALRAVTAMQPVLTYVYQYNSLQTRNDFVGLIEASDVPTSVIARDIN